MSTTPTRLRIGPADRGRRMTLEEFRDAEGRGGYLYELARGVLEVTNVPRDSHGQIIDNLHEEISAFRRENPGLILRIGHGSDIRFIIPELDSDRHPDLAVVLADAPIDESGHRLPALAVEVVSRGKRSRRRDYEEKREEYLRVGLREYWIVDPELRQVTVLVRRDGPGGPAWDERACSGDEAIGGALLPGFRGTVAGLWINADLDEDAE